MYGGPIFESVARLSWVQKYFGHSFFELEILVPFLVFTKVQLCVDVLNINDEKKVTR